MVKNGLSGKGPVVVCHQKHTSSHPFGVFYGQNPLEFSFPLVLLQVITFIVISRTLRFLLKPLRQPRVVSYILGGIIVGPSVLSRAKRFRAYMFPEDSEFMLKNIGVMGFMYFVFLSGVKMDLSVIKRAGKKHWYIALSGVIVPFCTTAITAIILRKSQEKELVKALSVWGVSSALSITAFPVLYPIVRELNLLSSEIGRLALSTAVISDIIGIQGIIIFEAGKQGEERPITALWYLISLIVVMVSIIGGVRQAMLWIVRTTPEGKPVDQIYVIGILLGVLVAGFVADMGGLAIANGPLWLGLAVPDGPPLGATLVQKSETIIMDLLMPFSFLYVGLTTDVYTISAQWSHLHPLFYMALVAYTIKMVSTLVSSRFFDMTIRDSFTLSLIMSLRGEVELLLFIHWMDFKMISQPHFSMLVMLTVTVTAIATPLISVLYDPTRPYMVDKRRNIQHTPPNTELHIVSCIDGEESLAGLINLLEISNPTVNSPFVVYALRLVELVGRAAPVFIDHENKENGYDDSNFNSIHNALKIFEEASGEYIKIHTFTTITSKRSMYQDICELALVKKASLIILPLYKKHLDNLNGTELLIQGNISVNSNILKHAPCSVGILVNKGSCYQNHLVNCGMKLSVHHFAVLFLGGSDAREALAYADRMAANPDVALTVIRFLAHDNEGDNEMEKKLDDGLVTWFWVKNEGNNQVVYREVVVKNGLETIAAIQAMNTVYYDLWIVGRKHGINPVLLRGLSYWSDNNELGIIGDFVASVDFDSPASVLVMQQQILRGQESASGSLLSRFCSKR
ncbi:cation H(+) antiporter 24-like [Olea europaea subsp. europaea]|uniref:Cation H(+) antiporter 24-like n=1 Tax=Olea europaea subsp. europaea TaxID=158383 RepID=A0A8S0S4P5_OLEEU|nr:cation H(+) antiporter 24-like [Olea europaea subsp. europaea]